jgi:two-component system, sporulation sensor kinase E
MVLTPSTDFHQDSQLANQCTIFVSKSLEILFISKQTKNLLELEENGCFFPIAEESIKKWQEFIEQTCQHSEAHGEIQMQTSAPTTITVSGSYDELYDVVIVTIQDIKQPARVQSSWPVISMFNQIELGMVVFDAKGHILDINQKALQYIGFSKTEVLTKHYKQMLKYFTYEYASASQFFENIEKKIPTTLLLQKGDSVEQFYYEIKAMYDHDNDIYIISAFDHTAYMRLQAQVKEQCYLKELGQMSASIAHEIRNPLTALKGFMELIKSEAPAGQENYFSIMDEEFQRLDSILSELLFLSAPRKSSLKKVDLVALSKEAIDFMQFEALMHNVILQLEVDEQLPHIVLGNEGRLKQMLINLIKNAIQAMNNQGNISIRLHAASHYVQLCVQDEGIGMSEEAYKNLFKPFFTTKDQGTGLGLPLVKKIMDDLNGVIEVESMLNIGTTFILTFPNALTNQVILQRGNILPG